jgi:TolA-binding protein
MRACALPLMLLLAGMLLSAGSAQCDDGASPPAAAAQTRPRPAGGEGASAEAQAQIEALQQDIAALRTEYESRISDLERKIEALSSTGGDGEEMDIRRAAEEAAGAGAEDESAETAPEETVFKSGALGLQALNPEISVVGDFIPWIGDADEGGRHSDLGLRVLGLHLESYLDPYSKFKASVPVTEDGAELGEAYITRYDAGRNLNVTLGKFHQQFGFVNRWHAPGLDQVEYPLALRQIFGGPLEATGVSLDWTVGGSSSASQGVTLQLTNGGNSRVFGQNSRNFPSALLRYTNYRDLSKDKYLELGLSALYGRNDDWQVISGGAMVPASRRLGTYVLGADLTVLWEPTEAMRYQNWVWRSEAYYLHKSILAPDGSGKDALNAWGAYSYFQKKISRTTELGLRADYYKPAVKSYADADGLSLGPLAVTTSGARQWQLSPYLTWWQSPWVKWRVEYDYRNGKGLPDDNRLWLQCTFAAGPHKHERY